jgi:hypothetical protein
MEITIPLNITSFEWTKSMEKSMKSFREKLVKKSMKKSMEKSTKKAPVLGAPVQDRLSRDWSLG